MSIEYINHITLSTGHTRKSYPKEVSHSIYFKMRRIVKDSELPSGVELENFPGYRLKTIRVPGGAVATIYGSSGIPIITIGCRSDESDGMLWSMLHENKSGLATKANVLPDSPYVADRLEPGSLIHPDALEWTGDFSRSFAWVILAPEQIR